ncbi:MAG: NADH-quinone oxidoreductase subunit C [Gammaproteobacteria bacterium]|nr:NADH-quinone oxidoreductase subunit C [Gammaproteobacteria bacterium]MBU1654915.1 NADH-quinone oxidoreductase subunit C [Gammaproteobacteria bacterium]MBU1960364.1 NADH-quinone oxidoreductase subunit C [Gammaproteobacteria bacterium]
MEERLDDLVDAIEGQFEESGIAYELNRAFGEVTLQVEAGDWRKAAEQLRNHKAFDFEELIDLCGVDYAAYGQAERADLDIGEAGKRFAVVCHLLSLSKNVRLRFRTFCENDPPMVASLNPIWNAANWFEREAFDMYGILFEGHPDLRRILTDYGFVGYPLRKDFPLSGHVEMRYDAEKRRVVYEPVKIEPRVLVPRVLRDDNRYAGRAAPESEGG